MPWSTGAIGRRGTGRGQVHRPAFGCMTQGVVDQRADDLAQPVRIGVDHKTLRGIDGQLDDPRGRTSLEAGSH